MPKFTIETTYRMPHYRHSTYDAASPRKHVASPSRTMTGRVSSLTMSVPALPTSPASGEAPAPPMRVTTLQCPQLRRNNPAQGRSFP